MFGFWFMKRTKCWTAHSSPFNTFGSHPLTHPPKINTWKASLFRNFLNFVSFIFIHVYFFFLSSFLLSFLFFLIVKNYLFQMPCLITRSCAVLATGLSTVFLSLYIKVMSDYVPLPLSSKHLSLLLPWHVPTIKDCKSNWIIHVL